MILNFNKILSSKETIICDFNNATNKTACDGTFTNVTNGQSVGVFQTFQINSNDITDFSSICKYFMLLYIT